MNFRPNPLQSPARGGLSQFSRRPKTVDGWEHVAAAKMGLSPYRAFYRRGYTLVEILVALALTLMIMLAVVKVFGDVGEGIRKSRNALEQFDRLRTAVQQLNQDLNCTTAVPDGRAGRPEEGKGYLELIEGSYLFANPNAPNQPYYGIQIQTTGGTTADYTVGERGDFLMFTVRNASRPFVGRYLGATTQSDVAEIAWFLRGNRLHRRVLLVVPGAAQSLAAYSTQQQQPPSPWSRWVDKFYSDNDISARLIHDASNRPIVVPNSLADLVKRENRFAHPTSIAPNPFVPTPFPFDVRRWGAYCASDVGRMHLANLDGEMGKWHYAISDSRNPFKADMWDNSPSGRFSLTAPLLTNLSDQALANNGTNVVNDSTRMADDVVLTNVIGFDVKVWEPAVNGVRAATSILGNQASLPRTHEDRCYSRRRHHVHASGMAELSTRIFGSASVRHRLFQLRERGPVSPGQKRQSADRYSGRPLHKWICRQ